MSKIRVTEVFGPVAQGEGKYVGVPSVFVRTFGCNFRCAGFGMVNGKKTEEPKRILEIVNKFPEKYAGPADFDKLPLATTGCDTYASVYPEFKKFARDLTAQDLVNEIVSLLQNGRFNFGIGRDVHLIFTGGEPLLGWQKIYPEVLEILHFEHGLKYVTFETNGTQHIKPELVEWFNKNASVEVTFSVSPKLSCSGESFDDAIQPDAIASYSKVYNSQTYLKFVVQNVEDFDEVEQATVVIGSYPIYIMPVGGVIEEYDHFAPRVCNWCMERGYSFSPRLHVALFGNTWGK